MLAPLHRAQLLEYAEKINSQTLPSIKSGPGLKLAPEKYTITAPNYCITSNTGASATFTNVSGSMNVSSRIVLPSNTSASSGGLAVYRVSNAPGSNPQGQLATVMPTSSTNSGSISDLPGSGIHVITPGNASASLIRVQSSTFAQPGHALVCNTTPNSASNSEVFCFMHRICLGLLKQTDIRLSKLFCFVMMIRSIEFGKAFPFCNPLMTSCSTFYCRLLSIYPCI